MEIKVLSHYLFDNKMVELGLNDNNVENTNMAFISIIGTDECIRYWIQENDKHYFEDHPNVLNLEFDDLGEDVMYNGHHFKTMNMEQAEESIDFIENMIDKGVNVFYIHCRAGMSRSRSFSEFIYRYCMEHDIEVEYEDRNDYTTMLNSAVLRKLNHAYWKKHKMNGYENDNAEYPNELTDIPIVVINRGNEGNRQYGKV